MLQPTFKTDGNPSKINFSFFFLFFFLFFFFFFFCFFVFVFVVSFFCFFFVDAERSMIARVMYCGSGHRSPCTFRS